MTPVHQLFADRPLEDVIRRLIEGRSVVVLRDDSDDPASGAGPLAEIRVIETQWRSREGCSTGLLDRHPHTMT
jgi:hypothetical protein